MDPRGPLDGDGGRGLLVGSGALNKLSLGAGTVS